MPELQRVRPPYEQIAAHYAALIANGTLKPGDRIPSTAELCAEWKVSKATVGKAISKLKTEGLIVTAVGIGTKVADQRKTLF